MNGEVVDTSIRKESRDRYLTYALSVVTGRALPDVRDGLKPVQRRILFAMAQELHLKPSGSHRKSAAVVGAVLARFHPHGDSACYEAMVRMAQDFSLRYPLVDGQGNFGSLDGDSAAAYRYTEAKLLPIALEVLGEIEEETVDFRDNFDATAVEPEVLPSRLPNLLMNGASGIAVGMATNIPPHNLRELTKALIELSNDAEMSVAKLSTIIKGPDFPTACAILNTKKELTEIYQSGRGSIRMRGEWELEEQARGKKAIIITSIPYALNKAQLVEKIADLIVSKSVPQLTDVRDESTDVVRVVAELASGADPEVAIAYLFKNTPLESNFAVNLTALVPAGKAGATRPELLSLKQCLQYFLEFREDVVQKRLLFEKRNLLERIHILEGLVIIFDALDQALRIVRQSDGRTDAAKKLRAKFKLSEKQAFAVVDMRIYQLSKTNITDIRKELTERKKRVGEINAILKSKKKIADIVRSDLQAVAEKFGDKRKSRIEKENIEIEFKESDYVVHEEVYAIVTADGWVKRIRQTNELSSTRIREGDRVLRAHPLSTLDSVALFTNQGYLYTLKVIDFPSSSGYGSPIQKVLKFRDGETITESFGVYSDELEFVQEEMEGTSYSFVIEEKSEVALVTARGMGFGLTLEGIDAIKRNGKRVLKVREGDALAAVTLMNTNLAMFTRKGSALQIKSKEIPRRANAAVGVSLMGVRAGDEVLSLQSFRSKATFVITSDSGRSKDVPSNEVLKGRRGLMGRKVLSRGQIVEVQQK